MFGKRKEIIIRVMHYEGIDSFIQDAGCEIKINEDAFIIKRIKPEVTVTLSVDQIIKCENLSEYDFMAKYHNCTSTVKRDIPKSFLVITYTAKDRNIKYLAFWAVPPQSIKFIDLQYKFCKSEGQNIVL